MATELALRESASIATIEKEPPEFASMCRDPGIPLVLMHQDAFAVDYQDEEFKLLGMAIKFAGICDKELQIIGKNRYTIERPRIAH